MLMLQHLCLQFYEQSISAGVPPTKKVFTALINAYAACGQFEKAKEVLAPVDLVSHYATSHLNKVILLSSV